MRKEAYIGQRGGFRVEGRGGGVDVVRVAGNVSGRLWRNHDFFGYQVIDGFFHGKLVCFEQGKVFD